jgi:hypothetical protein
MAVPNVPTAIAVSVHIELFIIIINSLVSIKGTVKNLNFVFDSSNTLVAGD